MRLRTIGRVRIQTVTDEIAESLGLVVEFIPGDWRHGVNAETIAANLAADTEREIKAVAVVHNETSTGVTSHIAPVRAALDAENHPALLLVDVISSLGSIDYRHDEWGVDVTIGGSQKGLMLPPGLGFNAVSERALDATKTGFFPYTPATNLLYGLDVALEMLFEEGLDNVFARHIRLAEATRRAVAAWGLENVSLDPSEHSHALTAVLMPEGHDADALREVILERYDMTLGTGLGKVKGKVFRIGHLGWFNDLMLAGTLSGVEMGLKAAKVPFQPGG